MAKIETERRRAAVLQHLADTPGYELANGILRMGAEAQGIPTSFDQIEQTIDWLEEAELVRARALPVGGRIVKLTRDGLDVGEGRRVLTGVARPDPEF